MIHKIFIKKTLRDLNHLKLQVFSISLIVSLGVAVLIGFTSTYDSLKLAQNIFYQESDFPNLFVTLKRGPYYSLNEIQKIPGVAKIEARLEFDGLMEIPNYAEIASAHLISIPDGKQPEMSQLHIKLGRLPNSNSINEVLVSEGLFKAHELELGSKLFVNLNGRKTELKLVGVAVSPEQVISIAPGSPMPDDFHFANLWVNQSLLEERFDMKGAFNRIIIKTNENQNEEDIKREIENDFNKYGVHSVSGRDQQISHQYVSEELKQLQVQATLLPFIFFFVAIYILNVVMTRMIQTQRQEIATFKALGVSNYEIFQSYLISSLLIVGVGDILGLIFGYMIGANMTELYTVYYHFPVLNYKMNFLRVLFAFSVTGGIGLLSLTYSLRSIFKLSPAESMRPATPSSFHNLRIEKSEWFQSLSVRPKMVFRGLISYPIKTVLSVFGLSFTILLLMTGVFWPSSIDYLLYAQYGLAQKETGSIQLSEALPLSAINEIRQIEGVLDAEGVRVEPIEVTFGTIKKKTSIRGFNEGTRLSSLIDQNLNELPLPLGGIFMTRILAKQLNVVEGQEVQVKFLSGRRESFQLKIVQIVDSMMSSEIITSLNTLSNLVKENKKVNTIYFKSLENPILLYNKLKEKPQILTVTFKESAIQTFTQTSAKFLLVFAAILSFFAGAIGFGVSYNNLQISLNERDWEIATLQILGFSIPDLFGVLASEVYYLSMMSIPVGWFGGYYLSKWMIEKMSVESFQIPFVMPMSVFTFSASILVISTLLSSVIIYRKLKKLDMIATLKMRG